MFNQIDDVYNWIYNQKKINRRTDLDRIKRCIKELDLTPNYKICHIAGTNGKGSVANYIKDILQMTGIHVGFFVSPFVISFNERIQINDRFISDAELMHYANILYDYSCSYFNKYNDVIPFFELTLLIALMFFKDRKIDYAVVECGLGGIFDPTNALDTEISIITNIGYDHMDLLGNTLEEISMNKLGIVRDNGLLITAVSNQLLPLFKDYTNKKKAKLIYINDNVSDIVCDKTTRFKYKGIEYESGLLGNYQAYNASLAIEAIKIINPKIEYDLINYALKHSKWPGRMEIISNDPLIIIDGGHNIHAIKNTVEYLSSIKNNRNIKIVFTSLADKDYKSMLNELDKIAFSYYFTSLNDIRKTDPTLFVGNRKNYKIILDTDECITKAIEELDSNDILFITGSLHLISEVRKKLKNIF